MCSQCVPKTVLVINNNPNGEPGHSTQLVIQHLKAAQLFVYEARTIEAVDAFADEVTDSNDVGLIVSCGSRVVLTEPVEVEKHVTKTTAAMLHFPNAPVVGICFGMQLLAVLYGGELVAQREDGHAGGKWETMRRTDAASRMLDGLSPTFTQWASNFIFVERAPPRFLGTAVDSFGRLMAMEHAHEHVYGVQFHPEVVREESPERHVVDGIIALVGQNRRIKASRAAGQGVDGWQCSSRCPLRRALRDATQCEPACGELALCLAAAKREALATLQRDHCRAGGITESALADAIASLRRLGGPGRKGGAGDAVGELDPGRGELQESAGPAPESIRQGLCSPHAADLRLRAAVKELLRKARSKQSVGSSSRTTSAGSARTTATSSTVRTGLPAAGMAAGGTDLQMPMASDCTQADALGHLSLHEADLKLRNEVKEIMQSGHAAAGCGQALAAARRGAMAVLRGEEHAGGVDQAAFRAALKALREAALACAVSPCVASPDRHET
mmetsp:Transcript_37024/g.105832  ORF Transcript_37024/g.105832 Transcript_37024/m.105832 type:complete len:501 (+) Transcript_37024:99-1601(+)